MKVILPRKSSLEGISNQSIQSLHVIQYANLNVTKCNMLMQTKNKPKTICSNNYTQTKNQNGKYETTCPLWLDKALFKGKKRGEGK